MELILLLTAFFSALTGAITGARGPDLRAGQIVVVASNAVRTVAPAIVVPATRRPAADDLALRNHIGTGAAIAFAIMAAVPLYVSRLRV